MKLKNFSLKSNKKSDHVPSLSSWGEHALSALTEGKGIKLRLINPKLCAERDQVTENSV